LHHLTYLQSVVLGLLQGVSEMFPVSSLGHSVLVPALIGGSWRQLATQQAQGESPYLAFIVGLHVATALALLCLFWKDWVRIIAGFLRSIATRRIDSPDAKLGWLIVIATIPAGITGLAFEHTFRTIFAKPLAAAVFLTVNGIVLLAAERLARRADAGREPFRAPWSAPRPVTGAGPLATRLGALPDDDQAIVGRVGVVDAGIVGVFQISALLAGISRSGITMGAGLLRGLNREQAIRFAFLLATPIILAAGLLKIPDLTGPLGNGIRPQVLAGSGVAFVAAFVAAAFLVRWFRTRTLTPFAVYCLLFGVACICYFR
jgi:undecaprenyl-diphosphatase